MSERTKSMFQQADELTGEALRQIHERGELRHLYGKPLDLDDDPDWLLTRTLKAQGFSHPVLEQAKELEAPRLAAEATLERLARRRAWLCNPRSRSTSEDVHAFNQLRERGVAEYREQLQTLNRAIRDFNLGVPVALHQRPIAVDDAVAGVEAAILPMSVAAEPHTPSQEGRRLRGFRRRR